MPNKQITKPKKTDEEGTKVWTGEDGIVYAQTAKRITEEEINELINQIEEVLNKAPQKSKIAINIKTTFPVRTSRFRRATAKRIKGIAENPGFEKLALFSENVIMRTTGSFILAAGEIKNAKVFTKKEKALEWLKRSD
jgi:hypothetical protein